MENLRYNLKLSPNVSALEIMELLSKFLMSLHKIPVELKGLAASSQDYDQSIHCTLDLIDLNTYWSSKGSASKDSTEWLLYQICESP